MMIIVKEKAIKFMRYRDRSSNGRVCKAEELKG